METEIELKDLVIDDKQAEQFAYSISNDIMEYLDSRINEFISWFFGVPLDIINNIIQTLDGMEYRTDCGYEYDLCKYEK